MPRITFLILDTLYRCGVAGAVWAALAPLDAARHLFGSGRPDDLAQRLGRVSAPVAAGAPRIVVHAASVGETAAAQPLVEQLVRRRPDCSIVLTSATRDGREAAERLRARLPGIERCLLLPWDRYAAVRRWLARLAPAAFVTVEAELWPNLFLACHDLDIPLFVVHGRISAAEARRYALAGPLFREALAAVRWFGVQDEDARRAFRRAGAPADRVHVAGDLKADRRPVSDVPPAWAAALSTRAPLVVAGSTHAPEEEWLGRAFVRLRPAHPGLGLVVAPRHARRAGRIATRLARLGLSVARWSDASWAAREWDVLLVDRLGPLAALYRHAAVVVAGGTLARRGGHNLFEPAAEGRAVVVGPHVGHVRSVAAGLERAGGLRRLPGDAALADALDALLKDDEARGELGRRAAGYCAGARGAAAVCAGTILASVQAVPPNARRTSSRPYDSSVPSGRAFHRQ